MLRHAWVFAIVSIIAVEARAQEKLEHRVWTVDGVKREAWLHVPPGAKDHPTPLIFGFHGHGQFVRDVAAQFNFQGHWAGSIVVYMKGLPKPNDEKGGPGWQYLPDDQGGRDLKFFDVVWASLHQELKVDDRRVYAAGFSNGAGFTFLLWSTRGDRFAAVSTCAMRVDKKNILPLLEPKPLLHVAGKKDDQQAFEKQEDTVEEVRKKNECGEGQPWQKHATLYPSKVGAPVVMLVHEGGHAIPHEAGSSIVKFFKEHPPNPASRKK